VTDGDGHFPIPSAETSRWAATGRAFREDNRVLVELVQGWPIRIYLYAAALTAAFQINKRFDVCEGITACGSSLAKAVLWALGWPFYWINYVTDFILMHPYGTPL
jgi:hypothetical protein